MRWDTYIPAGKSGYLEVRLATGGNWSFDSDSLPNIYTREPVILQATVSDASDDETITLIAPDGEFPDATFVCPPAVNGETTVRVDITEYVKAWKGDNNLQVRLDSEETTITMPSFICIDGTPPHSLVTSEQNITQFINGGAFGPCGGLQIYGKLPSVACVGDDIEIVVPIEAYMGGWTGAIPLTYAEWKAIYDYLKACILDGFYSWQLVKGSTVIAQHDDIRVVHLESAGLYQLKGFIYEWEPDETHSTGEPTIFDTGQAVKVLPDSCEKTVTVEWFSRVGNKLRSKWELVTSGDEVTDTIYFETLDAEFTGKKGAATKIKLRKRGLTASDIWYYGSIITSNEVTVDIHGFAAKCKVTTKSVQADMAEDGGDYYTLDIDLEYSNYDAV